jgi:hypothetical protein
LIERGVADYPLEQCRGDYKMALLLPAAWRPQSASILA